MKYFWVEHIRVKIYEFIIINNLSKLLSSLLLRCVLCQDVILLFNLLKKEKRALSIFWLNMQRFHSSKKWHFKKSLKQKKLDLIVVNILWHGNPFLQKYIAFHSRYLKQKRYRIAWYIMLGSETHLITNRPGGLYYHDLIVDNLGRNVSYRDFFNRD
jgi:hypothetical protein